MGQLTSEVTAKAAEGTPDSIQTEVGSAEMCTIDAKACAGQEAQLESLHGVGLHEVCAGYGCSLPLHAEQSTLPAARYGESSGTPCAAWTLPPPAPQIFVRNRSETSQLAL